MKKIYIQFCKFDDNTQQDENYVDYYYLYLNIFDDYPSLCALQGTIYVQFCKFDDNTKKGGGGLS